MSGENQHIDQGEELRKDRNTTKEKPKKRRYKKHSRSKEYIKHQEENKQRRRKGRSQKKARILHTFFTYSGFPFIAIALYYTLRPYSPLTEEKHIGLLVVAFLLIYLPFLYKKSRLNMIGLIAIVVTLFLTLAKFILMDNV